MKKGMKITLAVVGVLLALGYYLASPLLAVASLRKAAQAGNAEAITEQVDFPSVKESLKGQFNDILSKEMAQKPEDPFGKIGAAFASALIGPMVDAYITPENMALVIKGEKMDLKPGFDKDPAPDAPPPSDPMIHTRYETKDRFVVDLLSVANDGAQKTMGLVFRREGFFGWKLSSLRLPQ